MSVYGFVATARRLLTARRIYSGAKRLRGKKIRIRGAPVYTREPANTHTLTHTAASVSINTCVWNSTVNPSFVCANNSHNRPSFIVGVLRDIKHKNGVAPKLPRRNGTTQEVVSKVVLAAGAPW